MDFRNLFPSFASGPPRHHEPDLRRFPKLRNKFTLGPISTLEQFWANMLRQNSTRNAFFTPPIHPTQAMLLSLWVFQKFAMTAQPSLWKLVIDIQNTNVQWQRYFVMSQKIVARIEGFVNLAPRCCGTVAFRVLPIKPRAPVFPLFFAMKYVGASPCRRLDKLNATPTQFNWHWILLHNSFFLFSSLTADIKNIWIYLLFVKCTHAANWLVVFLYFSRGEQIVPSDIFRHTRWAFSIIVKFLVILNLSIKFIILQATKYDSSPATPRLHQPLTWYIIFKGPLIG